LGLNVATPIRRRIAALATCFVLAFAWLGTAMREVSEIVHEVVQHQFWPMELPGGNGQQRHGERPER